MGLSKIRYQVILMVLLAALLAGCSWSGEPKIIAAFPSERGVADAERYIPPHHPGAIVYHAEIELEVSKTEATAERARALAAEFGGYLDSSTSWRQDGERFYRLVLAVPVVYFDDLRDALVGLGDLKRESVWGEKVLYGKGGLHNYSTITLQLIPREGIWPSLNLRGWEPALTFQRAFEVFISIFGFLVDILIWVVVVVGPFLLIGWLGWLVLRKARLNRKDASESEADS